MAKRGSEPDYESRRQARIAENKARMEALGLRRAVQELNEMVAAATPARRPWTPRQYGKGPRRQSARLKMEKVQHQALPLKGCLGKVTPVLVGENVDDKEEEMQQEEEQQQQAAAAVAAVDEEVPPAPEESEDEGMGAVYDPVPGSPAHPAGGGNGAGTVIGSSVTPET